MMTGEAFLKAEASSLADISSAMQAQDGTRGFAYCMSPMIMVLSVAYVKLSWSITYVLFIINIFKLYFKQSGQFLKETAVRGLYPASSNYLPLDFVRLPLRGELKHPSKQFICRMSQLH